MDFLDLFCRIINNFLHRESFSTDVFFYTAGSFEASGHWTDNVH